MSYEMVRDDVPPFTRRIGDQVIQGSNNSIVILGRDRPSDHKSGLGSTDSAGGGQGTGVIHAIAGRAGKDPSFIEDKSFIYLSMKTDGDMNLEISQVEFDGGIGPYVIQKSDHLRMTARKDVKIVIDGSQTYAAIRDREIVVKSGAGTIRMFDDRIVIDAGRIELGSGASQKIILGDSFMTLFNRHTHPTSVGPSGKPLEKMGDEHLSQRRGYIS